MAISRIEINGDITSLGIALGALTSFFGSVEYDDDSSPTAVICKDDNDNVIFKAEIVNSSNWQYTAYKDENTAVQMSAASDAVAKPVYLYTLGNTGAVIELPNSLFIMIAKTTTGETGFVLPPAAGAAQSKGDVLVACWGDDIMLSTHLIFTGSGTSGGTSPMIGNQCLFVPVPMHGAYRTQNHLVNTFFMPMAQAGMRGTVQQITDGTSTYLTNGYLAMLYIGE